MKATCDFCGKEGIYGQDIIDEAFPDRITKIRVKYGCRDLKGCFARQDAVYKAWLDSRVKIGIK